MKETELSETRADRKTSRGRYPGAGAFPKAAIPVNPLDSGKLPSVSYIAGIMFLFIFLFILLPGLSPAADARGTFFPVPGATGDEYPAVLRAAVLRRAGTTSDERSFRRDRCLQAGRWLGAVSGGMIGVAHIYWSATGVSGIHGPFWKNVVTGIPSVVIGSYIGAKATEWTTRRILKGNPSPGRALLKGAAWGAVDGAVTFTAGLMPLLLMGYCMDTIHFNNMDGMGGDASIPKILGIAVIGGTLYGGTFGAAAGAVYGPCLSLYMRF